MDPVGRSVRKVNAEKVVGAASLDVGWKDANIRGTWAPTIENLTFVDQDGWKLSHDSAMTLIQSVRSSGH